MVNAIEKNESKRAGFWKLRNRLMEFDGSPKLMGIINVTPDSFSDGGRFLEAQRAIDQAMRMEDDGCDIIDLGGESTRPYSEPVSVDEELRRVVPVIERLAGRLAVPISIDTSKSSVARAALELGAEIVNDVTGLIGDPDMLDLVVAMQPGVCIMHMQGAPKTMQVDPRYSDVVCEIRSYLQTRVEVATNAGLDPTRICIDPGIGFGKTHEHNLSLFRQIETFHELGRPILVGHSRKGLIAHIIQDKECSRLYGTIGLSLACAVRGVQVLRVHDVLENKQALKLFLAALG